MNLHFAVMSVDDQCEMVEYWPYVAQAWRKIGITPILGYVSKKRREDLRNWGHVIYVHPSVNMPIASSGKLARWRILADIGDYYGVGSDMDMMPMNAEYFSNCAKHAKPNHFVFCGGDAWPHVPLDHGLFPSCYIIAQGTAWKKLLDADWKKLSGHGDYCHPDFSDEALFRELYVRKFKKEKLTGTVLARGWLNDCAKNRLGRENWFDFGQLSLDLMKILELGITIDAHMPKVPDLIAAKMLLKYVKGEQCI